MDVSQLRELQYCGRILTGHSNIWAPEEQKDSIKVWVFHLQEKAEDQPILGYNQTLRSV